VRALAVLVEDAAYLQALADAGPDAPLPPGRRTRPQQQRHAANAGRVSAT
jgi:hypothetical protein